MLIVAIVFLSIISAALVTSILPVAKSQVSGVAKPEEFYFHYTPAPLTIGSGYTSDSHILNTTKLWGGTQRAGPQSGSFDIYFYMAPDLAGNYRINGTLWVHLWINATGATPSAVFTITVYELSASGFQTVGSWNSGNQQLSPDIYDVNAIPGNAPLKFNVPSYTFQSGSSVVLQITVKPGAATSVSAWYDSVQYPSHVVIYSEDYARPISVKTYAVDNSETNLFYYNWSESQRKVIVRANVTDPFGGYDIYKVNMTILDPAGSPVLVNQDMTRVTDGLWRVHYSHIYEANWSYLSTAILGQYTVKVSVIDNNGYYHNIEFGAFEPFMEEGSHIFSIGVIVYYDPAFLVVDDVNVPLPKAQVYITWPNGTTETLPRYTSQNGFINLTHVTAGNYGFTILWKDVVVLQTTQYVDSSDIYTLKCRVYQLTVEVLGNNMVPVHGAYVIIYAEGGVGYGLETSNAAGKATFRLPAGTYDIEAHYRADYWLTVVTAEASKPSVSVANSRSETIILSGFPPSLWTTTGFWLIMALVAAILVTILIVFISRISLPIFRRRT